MDPDECLKKIRELVALHAEQHDGLDEHQTNRLVELVEALDGWLSRWGFLPQAWTPTAVPSSRRTT